MKNKKIIVLFAVIILTITAATMNIIYTKNTQPTGTTLKISSEDKSIVLNENSFEILSPQNMTVTMTRKNGEKITKEYYAVPMEKIIALVNNKKTDKIKATAGDNFSCEYTTDELADNVYLTLNKDSSEYGSIVLNDKFSTRFVNDIKILELK